MIAAGWDVWDVGLREAEGAGAVDVDGLAPGCIAILVYVRVTECVRKASCEALNPP